MVSHTTPFFRTALTAPGIVRVGEYAGSPALVDVVVSTKRSAETAFVSTDSADVA